MEHKILNLINKNEWDNILNLVKKNKIDPSMSVNETTFIHLVAANNKKEILKYLNKHKPDVFKIKDKKGDTPIHILANYGYKDSLVDILKTHPHMINSVDGMGNTVVNIFAKDTDFLKWIVENFKKVDLNLINSKNETVLTKNLSNKEVVKYLLENKADISIPPSNPPIFSAIENGYNDVVRLLLEAGTDINVKNSSQMTPFLASIYHKKYNIAKYLVNSGANINYMGPENDHNSLVLLTVRGGKEEQDMINFLLDKNIDVNKFDRFMNSSLHNLLPLNKKLTPEIVAKMVYYGNLNQKNMKKKTPLHIFLKNYDWTDYNKILSIKKLDMFVEDIKQNKPINYIKARDLPNFLNMVAKNLLGKTNVFDECKKDNFKKQICLNQIRRAIIEDNEDKGLNNLNSLKMIKGDYSYFGKFNSDTLHSMVYTILLLRKYDNLGIPFKFYSEYKSMNEKILLISNDLFISPTEKLISDIVRVYADNFYEITPYLIVWRGKYQYYIDPNLDFYIQKSLHNKKIRFIYFKLTIVASESSTHANIVVFDKEKGYVDRFEPYGSIPYLESEELDNMLRNYFKKTLSNYLGNKFKYFSPKDLNMVSFQTISNDTDAENKKLGDPVGYCLAWTIWYVEMRIHNPDKGPFEVIKEAKNKIVSDNKDSKSPFLDFIRGYASKLDSMKNDFFKEAGVKKIDHYNMVMKDKDKDLIMDKLSSEFKKIVKKQYKLKN